MTTDTQPLTAWEIAIMDSLRVDVDLSKDVPCAWTTGCERPAVWRLVNLCCGMRSTYCADHKQELDDYFALPLPKREPVDCARCGKYEPGHDWREL